MKKNFYQSKTFWGLLVGLIGFLFEIPEVMATGLAFAGYGFRDAMK